MLKNTKEKNFYNIYHNYMLSLCMVLIVGIMINVPACTAAEVYPDAIRLHIIANSDEAQDQAVKLKVRDSLLDEFSDDISSIIDGDMRYEYMKENTQLIKNIAAKTLHDNGYDYDVDVKVGTYTFPTRDYETATLLAGEYRSIKIVLGNGEGKNWWCVIYPPMCISLEDEIFNIEDECENQIVFKSIILEKLGLNTPQPSKKALRRLAKWLNIEID